MKKIVALILALSMVFVLCGCGNEDKFKEAYSSIYDELAALKDDCDIANAFNTDIMQKSGAENFGTIYNAVRKFQDENSLDKVKQAASTTDAPNGWVASVWVAACGVIPDEYSIEDANLDFWDDEAKTDEIISRCIEINTVINRVSERESAIKAEIEALHGEYGKKYSDEIDALNELYVECSLYADLVLEPTGTISEYNSNINTYDNNISRLLKTTAIF